MEPDASTAAPENLAAKHATRHWIRAIEAIKILAERPDVILPALIDEVAAIHEARPALLGATALSYGDLTRRAARIANWGLDVGLAPGEVVGLLLGNCPDYVAIWFGLTRIGCVVALLNTNLADEALAHCLAAAGARRVICGAALWDRLPPPYDAASWRHDESFAGAARDVLNPAAAGRAPRPADTALLIYTSGTTGLPKAAKITHARLVEWSRWFAGMMQAGPDDRLYNCLPMYHSVGGVVAVGSMLVAGGAVIIREKFSARRFWDDIADQRCTIFQYIGELCRYLAQAPAHPREASHALRLCCGNGLAGPVWEAFQARFKVPRILEYYAATEGNVSLYNVEGKPGAIGRVPAFLANRFAIRLIRCDPDGAPLRGDDGLCIVCGADEVGEAVGKIAGDVSAFDGYTDEAASARKILHGVLAPGDRWFRTGDLMRRDRAGYYYFVDRLGDTFRWKGENVSTTEVASVVSTCPGVIEAVVYGVAIPGQEGRAGMAALTVTPEFSLPALHAHLAARLPVYARPLFIRLCETLAATGTFKLQKTALQQEGFTATEPVFFDPDRLGFIPFNGEFYQILGARLNV